MKKAQIKKSVSALAMAAIIAVSLFGYPETGPAACALHLRPMQSAHQEGQAEGWLYHAGGRICSHP